MSSANKQLVTRFIKEVWNNSHFEKLDEFLHHDFTDHSLPAPLSADGNGLKAWVIATGKSFEHQTEIEAIVAEADEVIMKIKMRMKHVGTWRNIPATGTIITTVGYRYFKLQQGRITEHWALIDGNAIEHQLLNASEGCKIQD